MQNNDLYSIAAISLPHLEKSHPECQKKKTQKNGQNFVLPEPEELPDVESPVAAFVLVLAKSEGAVGS